MIFRLNGRILLVTLGVLLTIAVVGDFLEISRHLFASKGTAFEIFIFCLCKLPSFLYLLLPISLVVSVFIVFALLSRRLELRAIAAAGVSPVRILVPIVGIGIGAVTATVVVGELLVPPALDKTEQLMESTFGRIDSTSWRFFTPQYWCQGEGERIYRVGHRKKMGTELYGVNLWEFDQNFHITKRADVKSAIFENGQWRAKGLVVERTFKGNQMTSLSKKLDPVLDWPEKPDRFVDLRSRPKQRTIGELVDLIDRMQERGMPTIAYQLDLHNRFGYPVLGFMLALFALPWLVAPDRLRTLAAALIESMLLVFCAYFIVSMFTAAVSAGRVSAGFGVWMPVVLIFVATLPKWVSVLRKQYGIVPVGNHK
jgi:lipopolysaccharide export system permease protein